MNHYTLALALRGLGRDQLPRELGALLMRARENAFLALLASHPNQHAGGSHSNGGDVLRLVCALIGSTLEALGVTLGHVELVAHKLPAQVKLAVQRAGRATLGGLGRCRAHDFENVALGHNSLAAVLVSSCVANRAVVPSTFSKTQGVDLL